MKIRTLLAFLLLAAGCGQVSQELTCFPEVTQKAHRGYFPLASSGGTAVICVDTCDARVVEIAAQMLADDVGQLTGSRPIVQTDLPEGPAVVAGTIGHSQLIVELSDKGLIDTEELDGKWESYVIKTIHIDGRDEPLLVVAGSDRRGTAFGLASLCEAAGVSPWHWWADVTPERKKALYVQPGRFHQDEPDVQYRGIFINDERFGGWAKWVEQTFDKESGKVGPKVYEKVFELLLRLRGNYLWPAMHNGSQAFNADPQNARLADDYAIVMGSSHCEQMLRNNEDEWKNAGTWGDFNYITNRDNMIRYWEERVKTNGRYENIYTLGLRGIHDYPMEGADDTRSRCELMQKAIDDQRDILRRNLDGPIEEIPQVLCTYEEVLEAYQAGLQIPDEVTLLWSDDKHGYTRNLCNPEEMKRSGGAGIYYHLSYHGDPASWIWLSPLSPAFISTELTKAYTFGARKIWIFNVGDIKPAEKEITFAMELAWDLDRWAPEKAHGFIKEWASRTFGEKYATRISAIQEEYYRLQASGKDSHVWFIEYSEAEIADRLDRWERIARKAEELRAEIPEKLQAAYFELIEYPVRGAWMLNEYQLLARRSMVRGTSGDDVAALADAARATEMFEALNEWTAKYNKELLGGKWDNFFRWDPYHWYYTPGMAAPVCTEELLEQVRKGPEPGFLNVEEALADGITIKNRTKGEIPIWIHALTPVENFSKAAEDNIFCMVNINEDRFTASATPINNIWHSPLIGPMWSKVGTLKLEEGENHFMITELKENAEIDAIFMGLYPPFASDAMTSIPAAEGKVIRNSSEGSILTVKLLGFNDGVVVQPFDTPSYTLEEAPAIEYMIDLPEEAKRLEIRTLANLHVYEGRDIRYAVSIDGSPAETFSIHTGDFSAEWRWNVLRGYSSRIVDISSLQPGKHKVTIHLLDPGIVLQEIRIQ
ncbi:MAG: glycosyl hydrolase 115 family protein [Bacteroidales bacterium]|nr:glycosyl hydrolase 115 family protein [Bacteroidales bacterium]